MSNESCFKQDDFSDIYIPGMGPWGRGISMGMMQCIPVAATRKWLVELHLQRLEFCIERFLVDVIGSGDVQEAILLMRREPMLLVRKLFSGPVVSGFRELIMLDDRPVIGIRGFDIYIIDRGLLDALLSFEGPWPV